MEAPVAVFFKKRQYKRKHTKDEDSACCLKKFTKAQIEELLADFPTKVLEQNQYILNLLHQFGNSDAIDDEDFENVEFILNGKSLCESCLCIVYEFSDSRYEKIKDFYRVGAKIVEHGNVYRHYYKATRTYKGESWLNDNLSTFSEPMPHKNEYHIHAPTKKSIFEEKPLEISLPVRSLYKLWDNNVKIPKKNQIFAKCGHCQTFRKRTFEVGKCKPALDALKNEREKHKALYMAEKQHYYDRQVASVNHPHNILCVIYDGMHKEKTKLPRFSANPSKDLETVTRVQCNLYGFLSHRQGSNLHPKQGFGFLNLFYSDNADLILSCLIHLLNKSVDEPFPKNLSIQFDNASNNKCNEAFALFAYLVLEGVFYNVYGNTLLVNHTHEDIDRMFENANSKFKKADMVTSSELSALMEKVPYVESVQEVSCVWDINSFLRPFVRTVHDFGNAHHFWIHKNHEGNIVLHYKRYATDKWLPDPKDHTTFLTSEDKYGVLIFKEEPSGHPSLIAPKFPFPDSELAALQANANRLFIHPLLNDDKLEDRKLWWNEYLGGKMFNLPHLNQEWPIKNLKDKRCSQNEKDAKLAMDAIQGVEYEEADMPMVYSGPYVEPAKRRVLTDETTSLQRGEWPVKKIVKERTNSRTHKKEYLVEWKHSWVEQSQLTKKSLEVWSKKK